MKVLFVGFGSIAKRHIRNCKSLNSDFQIAVLRQHSQSTNLSEIQEYVSETFLEEQSALAWKPDAVFITNPAPFHIGTALSFAQQGCHLFIEKPLSTSLLGIDQLVSVSGEKSLVIMVGYVMRFSRPLQVMKKAIDSGVLGDIKSINAKVGQYLPDWRPGRDYRKTVTAQKGLGGGVVSELSHELDYVQWLVGDVKEVSAVLSKESDLEIDVEDTADIDLIFANGASGCVHLDMVSKKSYRTCCIKGEKGVIRWNEKGGQEVELIVDAEVKQLWDESQYEKNQMFVDEIVHFFDCIKSTKQPLLDIREGRRTVEMILAIKWSDNERKKVSL